ncbi:MAG: type IV secretion system DNA-binding domain-containing protein [bacterium]|nr:type IV secretion system DNA-binding domain-containing protein [bacterium]
MVQEMSKESFQFKTPQEELDFLRSEIKRKEEKIGAQGELTSRVDVARKEVAGYQKKRPEEVLAKAYTLLEKEVEGIVLDLAPEAHDAKIAELLGILQEKGVKNALSIVQKMNNPHIEDDFHRFLVEYIKEGFPVSGLSESGPLWKVLHMTLYEIALPNRGKEDGERRALKEILSSMEQFYAGMLSVSGTDKKSKAHFTIELALSDKSDEIVLYASVPNHKRDLFEKQILSIFPNARIQDQKNDYNIFVENGASLGSYAKLSRNPIFPLKTYDTFEHDPLNVVLNTFSKIEKDGGGAAIQVVFYPTQNPYLEEYKTALRKIQKGTPVKEAIKGSGFGGALLKAASDLFGGTSKKKDEEKSPPDQIAIENIQNKTGSQIVNANIRVIASAKTKNRAEDILSDIESSFNQLENTHGNKLSFTRLSGGKLDLLFKDFSFRDYSEKYALPLNLKELTTIMHVPLGETIFSPQLRYSKAGSAAAPIDVPQEGTFLGVNRYRNIETKIYLTKEDRLRHFYVVGQTGTGKTTLLKNMIAQDIKAGEGVCMIDPHGADIVDVLGAIPPERYDDVIYFDPGYTQRVMALNMLEYDPHYPEQKTFVVDELLSIFRKLFGAVPESMGPAFEQYFRNSTLLVMEHPESGNTLIEVGRVISDAAFRKLKLSYNKNPLVAQFWENAERTTGEQSLANFAQYVTNKFDVFLADEIMRPVIAQEKSTFDFRKIMDEKKILLVNLSKGRLGELKSNLIGLVIVGKILMAALSRSENVHESSPFYLYIDEFQNVTTDSISTILSEARKYKLSLAVAHQFIAQLEEGIRDSVFGNVGSMAVFRVGADDAEYLEKQFKPVFSANDLLNIDNLNAYVRLLINGRPAQPFNIEISFFPRADVAKVAQLKELSYMKYGRPREEVEAEVKKKYSAF